MEKDSEVKTNTLEDLLSIINEGYIDLYKLKNLLANNDIDFEKSNDQIN